VSPPQQEERREETLAEQFEREHPGSRARSDKRRREQLRVRDDG
jgi:hypothetical protein